MRLSVDIGPSPADEACAAVGVTRDAPRYNRLECRAYIVALRKAYGAEPGDSRYRIKSNSHDFGSYSEVVYEYDPSDPSCVAYAEKAERGLATWRDAAMWTPVIYDDHQQVIRVLADETLWDWGTNPDHKDAV